MWRLILLSVLLGTPGVEADEPLWRFEFSDDTVGVREVQGRLIVEAQDGGVLVEDRAGGLWTIPPAQHVSREQTSSLFTPLTAEEWRQTLQAILAPDLASRPGARAVTITQTPHYVVATQGELELAEKLARVLEALHLGFVLEWEEAGLTLREPRGFLCVLVFTGPDDFADYVTRDSGPQLADNPGYYSMRTNRIVLLADPPERGTARPRPGLATAEGDLVRTLVHEGIHQLAYNCGLHTRYADMPVWLTEGMAMTYETLAPELVRAVEGSSADDAPPASAVEFLHPLMPRTHRDRLQVFRANLPRRRTNSLRSLVAADERFRHDALAGAAYSEAWALTHYLLTSSRQQYVAYLKELQDRPPLTWAAPEERITTFEQAFGPLPEVNAAFLRHVRRLRR